MTAPETGLRIWAARDPMSPSDAEAWDAYVKGHAGGTIFHSRKWQDILANTFRRPCYHIALVREGSFRGLVSLYRVRTLSGKKNLYSLPFTAYGGLLADDPETANAIMAGIREIAKDEGVGTVYLRNTLPPPGVELPGTDQHVYFSKPLPSTAEGCLEMIPRKSRATVRKAISNHGLTHTVNRDWETLWELHAVNLKQLGTPVFPREYFRNIMAAMEDADILFVNYQGKPVCGVMTFYFKDVCNPYFSGCLSEFNFTGCNNYMYYALMCHGLARGSREFDFGKSRKGSGSYDFKVNMGFEPRVLPFQFLFTGAEAKASNFSPSNPKLALFLRLWSSQPLWTSKLAGPILNRFLP